MPRILLHTIFILVIPFLIIQRACAFCSNTSNACEYPRALKGIHSISFRLLDEEVLKYLKNDFFWKKCTHSIVNLFSQESILETLGAQRKYIQTITKCLFYRPTMIKWEHPFYSYREYIAKVVEEGALFFTCAFNEFPYVQKTRVFLEFIESLTPTAFFVS